MSQVQFELTGGTLTDKVIGTGTPTLYGWLNDSNASSVSDGIYTLQSVASYAGGVSGTSPAVTIVVGETHADCP